MHPDLTPDERAWLTARMPQTDDCGVMRPAMTTIFTDATTAPIGDDMRSWLGTVAALQDGSCLQTFVLWDALRRAVT